MTDTAPELLDILWRVGELKRVRSAGQVSSIAERFFARAWSAEVAGIDLAYTIVADALVATTMSDIDTSLLRSLGVDDHDIARVRRDALAPLLPALDAALADRLCLALQADLPAPVNLPAFVVALAEQPRAGVTRPGRARMVFEPAESHAEHCAVVAIYGVLLAPRYAADPKAVFLAGLSHHLHNAILPDAGFSGEEALGPLLEPLVRQARERVSADLPASLRARIALVQDLPTHTDTPEARAFHAADTLDRVMQIAQHLRPGQVSMRDVLGAMALVHPGPAKAFQDEVLAEFGLHA